MNRERFLALPPHAQGILIAFVGVFILSFDALLVRLAAADPWTTSFWRGFLIGLTMLCICIWRGDLRWRPATRRVAILTLGMMVVYGINTSLFVFSVSHTHAANTVVILASAPFFAALFSRWWLKEYLPPRTQIAIAVCLTGVVLVFGGSMGSFNWQGDALALLLAMSTGGLLTVLRYTPQVPRTVLVAGAGLVTAIVCIIPAQPLDLAPNQFGWLLLMGMLQMPAASFLLMMAPKYLPSPEVSLFLLVETILAPLWVWWALSEEPTAATLWGGALILTTIAIHASISLRQERIRRQNPVI
ncbi:DMT family transporter [Natronospirillum operosum]|uniref:DMT family transporter n=1 Tax=Natronospirillum operosum TaxID=2759953 RepID=UPI001F0CE6CE|nr:DMT family transporter [Natronospirillum operosum]